MAPLCPHHQSTADVRQHHCKPGRGIGVFARTLVRAHTSRLRGWGNAQITVDAKLCKVWVCLILLVLLSCDFARLGTKSEWPGF